MPKQPLLRRWSWAQLFPVLHLQQATTVPRASYGTIEDSPCSIVPDDHKLEVDMGDIGAAKLTGGGTTTPKDFQIRLQDCVFSTETNMETTFTGTNYAGPANTDNYALFNVDSGVAMKNVSTVIGDTHGKGYKVGEKIVQPIVMDASTSKGKDKQTLNFKARLVGETEAPDPTSSKP